MRLGTLSSPRASVHNVAHPRLETHTNPNSQHLDRRDVDIRQRGGTPVAGDKPEGAAVLVLAVLMLVLSRFDNLRRR